MSFRSFLQSLDKEGLLARIKKPVSVEYEIANVLAALDGKPVIFDNVKNYNIPVAGGICGSRDLFAKALKCKKEELLFKTAAAAENLVEPEIVSSGPCQEETAADLTKLPILKYLPTDGGKYIPSAICVIKDPELGRNTCFHRLMVIDKNKLVARIVEGRGTHTALQKVDELDVAICIGNSIPVLFSAATSLPPGKDELAMANAMEKTDLVKCKTIDLEVPADCEIVIEGKMLKETADEGPFLDLTETNDKVRKQPIIEVKKITHRKNPVFQALLPGKAEHKLLMGMPCEPAIYNAVNKVCKCKNVLMTLGGCSWLHAIVQIEKKNPDDGKKAIEAAFEGHKSLKHCVVVDGDVNVYDSNEIERSIALRFQADKDAVIKTNQPGSSLDPSADYSQAKARTAKAGFDATIPRPDPKFKKVEYRKVNLSEYL